MVFQKFKNDFRSCQKIGLLFVSTLVASEAMSVECNYRVTNDWGSGFTAEVTVNNDSSSAINGWEVQWQQNTGSSVVSSWNANVSGSNPYTASNVAWNAVVSPGQSRSFGLQGNGGDSGATILSCTAQGGTSSSSSSSSSTSSNSSSSSSSSSSGGCAPTAITSYLQVDGGAWQQTANVTIPAGSSVQFGPQPLSGTWSWSGCGTSGSEREQTVSPASSCTATATYTNSCGAQSTRDFSVTVEEGGPESLVVAINAGGPGTTYDGNDYWADTWFSGGSTSTTSDPIAGVAEDLLFQSERYGSYSYRIPVSNAIYSVELQFAEIFHTSAGQRSFNVTVEGQSVLSEVDLFTLAGHDGAYTYEVDSIQVSDGELTVEVETLVDNGTLSGFAVHSATGQLTEDPPTPGDNASAGCGLAPALSSGRHNINVNGLNREYIIDIPGNYDRNKPYRLIYAWHWLGGTADIVANDQYYNMKGVANGNAIFVAPDRYGSDNGWPNTNGRDMDFLRAMVERINSSLCINKDQVFSVGWSYGGMMSFAVGREMPGVFRAIAPASGALWTPHNDQGQPMAAWIAHGRYDDVVSLSAGEAARDLYLQANNCSNNTVPVDPSPCVEYQGCDAGHPVVWCVTNGGHGTPSFYSSGVWNFFNRF